jgi:hypothetical protein
LEEINMAAISATTLAVAALATAAIGTGVAVYGQVQQAKTAKAIGKWNAKAAENQARQTEMDAAENIRRKRRESARLLATQRSRYAKAGVLEEGTPLELLAETAGTLEMEVLDYDRQMRLQAAGLRAQGAMDLAMGANQARAAYIGAGSTLLSGASSMASAGFQFQQAGAFTSGAGAASAGFNYASTRGAATSSGTIIAPIA